MTFKVGDTVMVRYSGGWDHYPMTVLAVQDCDTIVGSPKRRWVVVAYKSDIPQVFQFDDVRPYKEIVKDEGFMLPDGSIILGKIMHPDLHVPVTVTYSKVNGKVDLTQPYTVQKREG